mgnify:CR=1 FL=1
MQIKSKFSLYVIIILMAITIVVGIYKQYETKEVTKRTIDAEKRIVDKTIEIETDKEVDAQVIEPISLGEFKLTAYCSCKICCNEYALNRPIDEDGNEIVYGAIGERLIEGYSIAVDPDIIPYGAEIIINGHTYKAQDCGGAIKGNRIDVYFENHEDALEFGVQYANVYAIPA